MAKANVTVEMWKCENPACKHKWQSKGKRYPRFCPKCRSPRWDSADWWTGNDGRKRK